MCGAAMMTATFSAADGGPPQVPFIVAAMAQRPWPTKCGASAATPPLSQHRSFIDRPIGQIPNSDCRGPESVFIVPASGTSPNKSGTKESNSPEPAAMTSPPTAARSIFVPELIGLLAASSSLFFPFRLADLPSFAFFCAISAFANLSCSSSAVGPLLAGAAPSVDSPVGEP